MDKAFLFMISFNPPNQFVKKVLFDKYRMITLKLRENRIFLKSHNLEVAKSGFQSSFLPIRINVPQVKFWSSAYPWYTWCFEMDLWVAIILRLLQKQIFPNKAICRVFKIALSSTFLNYMQHEGNLHVLILGKTSKFASLMWYISFSRLWQIYCNWMSSKSHYASQFVHLF